MEKFKEQNKCDVEIKSESHLQSKNISSEKLLDSELLFQSKRKKELHPEIIMGIIDRIRNL